MQMLIRKVHVQVLGHVECPKNFVDDACLVEDLMGDGELHGVEIGEDEYESNNIEQALWVKGKGGKIDE